MNREIKFRGLLIDGGVWVYGYYFIDLENKKSYIHLCERENTPDGWMVKSYEVIPKSVGQLTGLKDKNGVNLFDGDIYHQGDKNILYKVVFKGCGFVGNQIGNKSLVGLEYFIDNIKVIGNIYENPELLNK